MRPLGCGERRLSNDSESALGAEPCLLGFSRAAAAVPVAAPFVLSTPAWFLSLVYASTASVALIVCVTLHSLLVSVGRQRLRDCLIAYVVALQPLLLNSVNAGTLKFTVACAVVFSPTVLCFWWLYYRLLPSAGNLFVCSGERREDASPAKVRILRLTFVLATVGGLTFVAVELLRALAESFVEEGQWFLLSGQSATAAFIAIYWGAITHFVLKAIHRDRLRHYTYGFLVFSALFAAKDVMPAAVLISIDQMASGAFDGSEFVRLLGDIIQSHVVYQLLIIPSGPLIWWLFHRAFASVRH